jgi:small subunit ribosomal protein S21
MAKVSLKNNYEKFDQLLRRFKRACDNDKIVLDARSREFFEKPTTVRKKAKKSAIKRQQKKLEATEQPKRNY